MFSDHADLESAAVDDLTHVAQSIARCERRPEQSRRLVDQRSVESVGRRPGDVGCGVKLRLSESRELLPFFVPMIGLFGLILFCPIS
jgi:hypothetical protein